MDTKNLKPDVGGGYPWDTDGHPSGPANPSGMGTASDFANQAVTDAAMANSESHREVLRRASDESSRVAHMCRIWSARRSRSSSRHGCSSSVCLGSTPILWGGFGRSSARTSTNQPATSALPPWRLTSSRIARMLKRESTSLSNSVF